MSILIGLNSAIRSIRTHNYALDTVSHNLANMNNPEYSRQIANISTTTPVDLPGGAGQMGTGSRLSSISRIRDVYLDRQIRNELSELGKWEELNGVYKQLKALFPEIDNPAYPGIQAKLEEFWGAWDNLAAKIDSGGTVSAEKSIVMEKAQNLAMALNAKSGSLTDLQVGINAKIRGAIDEVNCLTNDIYNLNKAIVNVYGRGQNPNDLLDKRTEALAKLSQLVDINVGNKSDGSVVVQVQSHTLVEGANRYNRMINLGGKKDSKLERIGLFEYAGGDPVDITDSITKGKIGGLLEARDEVVHWYRMQADMLASSTITVVNNIYNAADPSKPFFTGDRAATMMLNSQITTANDIVAEKTFSAGSLNIAEVMANMDNKLMSDWVATRNHAEQVSGAAVTLDTPLSELAGGTGIGELEINGTVFNYDTADTLGEFINKINNVDPESFIAVYDEDKQQVFMMINEYTTIREDDGMHLIQAYPPPDPMTPPNPPDIGLRLVHQKMSAAPINYPNANEGRIIKTQTWEHEENKFDITPFAPQVTAGTPDGLVIIRQGTTYYDSPGAAWDTQQTIQGISLYDIKMYPDPNLSADFLESDQKIYFNSSRVTGNVYEVMPFEMWDRDGNFTKVAKFAGNVRFENFYDSVIQTLESETENSEVLKSGYESAVAQFQQIQENITEVNEDEELARARAYQRAYDASVKLLSIIDQMLNMLINRTATPSDSWDS